MAKAWGISQWKCVRRSRRKESPPTTKWPMSWWQNSAPQTTTCHPTTQWVLQTSALPDAFGQTSLSYFYNHCVFSKHVYDQKNIRRRVYDALNVLMAMNIISKEKKEIKWIGLPTNSAQECQNLEVRWSPSSVKHIIFPKSSPMTLLTGGEAKTAGADQAETITASGAHPAGIDGCWCSRVQLHTGSTHTPGPFWSFHLNSC